MHAHVGVVSFSHILASSLVVHGPPYASCFKACSLFSLTHSLTHCTLLIIFSEMCACCPSIPYTSTTGQDHLAVLQHLFLLYAVNMTFYHFLFPLLFTFCVSFHDTKDCSDFIDRAFLHFMVENVDISNETFGFAGAVVQGRGRMFSGRPSPLLLSTG